MLLAWHWPRDWWLEAQTLAVKWNVRPAVFKARVEYLDCRKCVEGWSSTTILWLLLIMIMIYIRQWVYGFFFSVSVVGELMKMRDSRNPPHVIHDASSESEPRDQKSLQHFHFQFTLWLPLKFKICEIGNLFAFLVSPRHSIFLFSNSTEYCFCAHACSMNFAYH